MVNRQFCSAPDPKPSLNDSTNASGANHLPLDNTRRDGPSLKTLTCRPATDTDNNKNGDNTNNNRRMSLATRAGALVRQISSRANLTSETQPLTTTHARHSPPSAKMALFHTRTASVHVENGEWSLALKSYNRSLIHHRQLYGQDSAQCATTLNGIGVCLMNLLDEESRLCRDYVRYAECALREALYIRGQLFGTDSDEIEEVEINMELLLGSGWNDDDFNDDSNDNDETSKVDCSGRTAVSQSRGSSNPPSRCSSTDSLSGNNFQRAARRLFGGSTSSTNTVKETRHSRNQISGNDTASSSSSSSSSLSSQEEQIDFQYPSSFVDVDLSAKDKSISSTRPSTAAASSSSSSQPRSSSSNKSLMTSSSGHSTASFGNVEDDDGDDSNDDGINGMVISDIDLWALDDSSGDEIEQHRSPPSRRPLDFASSASRSKRHEAGRPSPTHACSVLFSSIN